MFRASSTAPVIDLPLQAVVNRPTVLFLKQVGDLIDPNPDLIGKYAEGLLQERLQLSAKPTHGIEKDVLRKRGLL